MKVFTIEGQHWIKDVEVDASLYEEDADVYFEAMTLGVESFIQGDYVELHESNEEPALGAYMVAYEQGNTSDEHKSIALTEYVLYNAG